MSQSELRELLHDRVADETTIDLAARAWRRGQAVRRRRSLAVVGGVTAGAVAVSAGIAWVDRGTDGTEPDRPASVTPSRTPDPSTPAPSPTAGPRTLGEPDATYQGTPVWWSPDQEQERALPYVADGPLPRRIDLDSAERAVGLTRADAAFERDGRVLVLGSRLQSEVDIRGLDRVTKENGYRLQPASYRMLSPGGTRLLFPQDGSVEVYTIATGRWASTDTGALMTAYTTWIDDDHFVVPGQPFGGTGPVFDLATAGPVGTVTAPLVEPSFDHRYAGAYGPTVARGGSAAQAWGMGVAGIPVRDTPEVNSGPELVATDTPSGGAVLAIMERFATGSNNRYKDCCPVVGWLDDSTLVYLSAAAGILVAWTVGTHEFRVVATISGTFGAASFAAFD